jgi:spermidine synthase
MANDKPKVPKCIKDGWFSEVDPGWAGQKLSIALEGFSDDSILFHEQTQYQDILVFRSAQHGNVLVLDGVLQLTESDEFVYQVCNLQDSVFITFDYFSLISIFTRVRK